MRVGKRWSVRYLCRLTVGSAHLNSSREEIPTQEGRYAREGKGVRVLQGLRMWKHKKGLEKLK